jgi:SAM-dependent methyltransferase
VPEGLERGLRTQQRDWEELAALDPLWAILSDPARRGGGWALDDFFDTGKQDAARVLRVGDELGRPRGRGSVLDFGCGVGRVTRAFAGHFSDACGVDISPLMVERARELNADVPNCRFAVNAARDLASFETGCFDLVYSRIVLQHLRGAGEVRRYLEEFLRVVRPDGLVVFQLPDAVPFRHRLHLRRRLYAVLRAAGVSRRWLHERARLSAIRVIGVPQLEVRRIVEAAGGTVARAEADDAVAGITSFQYYAHRV